MCLLLCSLLSRGREEKKKTATSVDNAAWAVDEGGGVYGPRLNVSTLPCKIQSHILIVIFLPLTGGKLMVSVSFSFP